MVKPEWLDFGLIYGDHFTLCLSQEAFDAEWADLEWEGRSPNYTDGAATVHYGMTDKGKHVSLVCVDQEKAKDRDPVQVAALLVHEAVHVWQSYRDRIRERSPSSEFEAYSIQAISQELMQEYVRQTT